MFRVLDTRLEGQYSMAQAQKAATLALHCLAAEPKLRPDMNEVVTVLQQLQESRNKSKSTQKEHNGKSNMVDRGPKPGYPRPAASPLHA